MGIYARYFELAAVIWQDYFDGKINMSMRDAKLRVLKGKWGIN